jgi:hypothetical protein
VFLGRTAFTMFRHVIRVVIEAARRTTSRLLETTVAGLVSDLDRRILPDMAVGGAALRSGWPRAEVRAIRRGVAVRGPTEIRWP